MLSIFRFEIRYRLRMASTYIYFLLLGSIAFLMMTTDASHLTLGSALTKNNAPLVIAELTTILMALGSVIATGIMGTAIYRDYETKTHELFFTTRITKRDYLLGRFLGSWVVTVGIYSAPLVGLWLGTRMPWVERWKLGPFVGAAYAMPFFSMVLPNVFLLGAVFFMVGALTRSPLATYVSGVLFLVAYLVGSSLIENLDNHTLAGMLDPFGLNTLNLVTRYWPAAARNSRVIPLTGLLLWNRLLWTGVGAALFAVGYRLFRFSAQAPALRGRKQAFAGSAPSAPSIASPSHSDAPLYPNALAAYGHLCGFYMREILRGVPFRVIVLCGFLLTIAVAWSADQVYGTSTYPVTRVMVETTLPIFALFFLVLIAFYTGELVWRERTLQLDQIADAQPIPTWVTALSKMTAILGMLVVLNGVLILAGMATQAAKGYFHFEPGLYVSYLFGIDFPAFVCITALAFCIHTLVNHKFLGHGLLIGAFFVGGILRNLGWDHTLYLFADGLPRMVYSDMNGYGPFLHPAIAFHVYWLAFSLLLVVLSLRLWVRGKETRLKQRWKMGRPTHGVRLAAGLAALCWMGTGIYIFINTNIRNEYFAKTAWRKLWSIYEKRYKARYASLPQPRITDVKLDMTLYPERSQYAVQGTYILKNKTEKSIRDIVVVVDRDQTIRKLQLDRDAVRSVADKRLGFYVLRCAQPLRPGEEARLEFDLAYDKTGFPNDAPQTEIVANGTFIESFLPSLGYQPNKELAGYEDRHKEGLAYRPRMASAADLQARQNTYIGNDADWITYEATLRTAPDQIALTSGYLQREWTEAGRRCFHYKMDAPIRNFVPVVSARYRVYRDRWVGADGKPVAIEIYYHPEHAYNLERMAAGAKKALAYCSRNYSPYQFRQLRILEFPAYKSIAQSFANTIPYSESAGFIAQVRKGAEDIDYPFYITAHETAHQWWAHQVLGGDVEGSEMLAESLAEYSALMVMKEEYGPERIRKFLRYNLYQYLAGRGREGTGENALLWVQHQPYIHYNKGALVFYALQDQIGERRLNAALARFVKDKGCQEPRYTTSLELYEYLQAATPGDTQRFLSELCEKITFFEDRMVSAERLKIGPNRWKVTLKTQTRTLQADSMGNEKPISENAWIEVGIYGRTKRGERLGKPLVLERKHFTREYTTLTYEVAEEPEKAGIDPNTKLIDREPDDNLLPLSEGSGK